MSSHFNCYYEVAFFETFFPELDDSSQEDNQEKYLNLRQIFEELVKTHPNAQVKFDNENRKILIGYASKKELKKAFPEIKSRINIVGLVPSGKQGLPEVVARRSSDYQTVLRKREAEKQQQKAEFRKEMEVFYQTSNFSERPLLNVSQCHTSSDLIRTFLSEHQGFGVGDTHAVISLYQFFIHHMPLFKELGVTTIFSEDYPEHLKVEIEKYFSPQNPSDRFPKKLIQCLNKINSEVTAHFSPQNFSQSVQNEVTHLQLNFFRAMKESGMQYRSLERRELCQFDPNIDVLDQSNPEEESHIKNGAKWRMKPMNYSAYTILRDFSEHYPTEKYIYLCGNYHGSTYDVEGVVKVPGIATMTQTPWISIFDTSEEGEILIGSTTPQGKEILDKEVGCYGVKAVPDAILKLHIDQSKTGKILQ